MVFNAIDYPDIVSSSKQPKNITLEYALFQFHYALLSFPAFLI